MFDVNLHNEGYLDLHSKFKDSALDAALKCLADAIVNDIVQEFGSVASYQRYKKESHFLLAQNAA